jgi:hypothetical protein
MEALHDCCAACNTSTPGDHFGTVMRFGLQRARACSVVWLFIDFDRKFPIWH